MHYRTMLLLTLAAASLSTEAAAAHAAGPWIEFADLEHQGGCPPLIQAAANAQTIAAWNQEKLDELYACAKAGPIPDGFLKGQVIFASGGGFDHFVDFAGKIGFPLDKAQFKTFAESLWQGKQFYKKDSALLNKIGVDVKPVLGHDIRGQMRFPAKVYCGQSLLDSRRESIVIDYAFSDQVTIDGQSPFIEDVDWIAAGTTKSGKRGLSVRDEVRMIHPGFYLGRAYIDRVFVLNFTLSTDTPVAGQDVCWPGYATEGA